MANNVNEVDMCACRGRMVTNMLYECLEGPSGCPFKIGFGNGEFCAYRLNSTKSRPVSKPIRHKENDSEQWDR